MTDMSYKQVEEFLGIKFDDDGYITLELEDINDLIEFNIAEYIMKKERGKGGGK